MVKHHKNMSAYFDYNVKCRIHQAQNTVKSPSVNSSGACHLSVNLKSMFLSTVCESHNEKPYNVQYQQECCDVSM